MGIVWFILSLCYSWIVVCEVYENHSYNIIKQIKNNVQIIDLLEKTNNKYYISYLFSLFL